MVSIQTAWITSANAGQKPAFTVFTSQDVLADAVGQTFYLTNNIAVFEELLPERRLMMIDIMALRAYAFSDAPLERAEQLFEEGVAPTAEGLWKVWTQIENRLLTFPLWALETIELLLRDLDEKALAKLFGDVAHRVRHAGTRCGHWTETFKSDRSRNERKDAPRHEDCSPLSPERITSHLMPGGVFARLMPKYEARLGQLEMLKSVIRAFNEGKHLVVEAGTGVGKSLAYLIPAAAWARLNDVPVVVSTNTRNLQSQLIEKDLPLVLEAIRAEFGTEEGKQLRLAVLKGRSNYLCLRQFGLLLEHSQFELDRPELRLFTEVVAWAVQSPDGDLDAFAGASHAEATFLSKLASVGEECAGRACRFFRRCFLQKVRAKALGAHLIVANHALVFSDLQSDGGILPPYEQLVFDEAHNLEEAATRHLSIDVSPYRLSQILHRLSRTKSKRSSGTLEVLMTHLEKGALTADETHAQAIRKHVRETKYTLAGVHDAAHELFLRLQGLLSDDGHAARYRCEQETEGVTPAMLTGEAPMPSSKRLVFRNGAFMPAGQRLQESELAREREALRLAIKKSTELLTQLADLLRQDAEGELALYGDQASNIEGAVATLQGFCADVNFVLDAQDPAYVFWAEPAGRFWHGQASLVAAPLKISAALAERLYAKKRSIIFCSATLRVGGSFDFIGKRLGLDKIDQGRMLTCIAESPFNYLQQCATYALTCMPEPTGTDGGSYVEQLSAIMLDVFIKTQGRALGLFTSYEMMNKVVHLIETPLRDAGIRLLVHGSSGTRDQITRVFRSGDGPCVLLGAQSFWEGVDVAGDALSCVVMARLPFLSIGDPIVEARCEQIEQSGGSSFREFSMPQAVIRFRQGFGRLIRTCTDKGIVIVADPRLVTRGYGTVFSRSLPCPVRKMESPAQLLKTVEQFFG
jgi:ATP-dependent DNA helicase DinG